MEFQKIERKRVYEDVIVQIEQMIKEGNYKPGDKLPPLVELCEKFSVSRTVIREAMSVLSAYGLVDINLGTGIFIRKSSSSNIASPITSLLLLNQESVKDLLELRRGLEVEAASLAAERATDDDISMLKQCNNGLREAINNHSDILEAVEEDYKFHKTLFQATGNEIFVKVFDSVSHIFKEGIKLSKMQSVKIPGRALEGVAEHELIIHAIERKNKSDARKMMRQHLYNNEKKTWNLEE